LELTNADVAARVQGVAEVCSDVASVAGRRSAIGYPQKNGTGASGAGGLYRRRPLS